MYISRMRLFSTPAVGLLGVILCVSTQVQADSGAVCSANAGVFVNTMGGPFGTSVVQNSTSSNGICSINPNTSLNGVVSVNAITSTGPAIHTFAQSGAASATGSASVSSLGAVVSGTASSTPMSYFYTDFVGNGRASDNNYQASAGGSVYAEFWDTLRIIAAPGALPGAKVELLFTLNLDGGGIVGGNGYVTANSSLAIRQGFFGGGGGSLSLSSAGSTSVVLSLDAYTVYTPYEVTLSGLLDLSANALAGRTLGCIVPNIWCTTDTSQYGNYYANSSAVGSYGSTASFYIDVLTPGASFTSDSGMSYNAPVVPVPAAAWLFVSGLIGLVGVARRKQA